MHFNNVKVGGVDRFGAVFKKVCKGFKTGATVVSLVRKGFKIAFVHKYKVLCLALQR